MSKIPNVRNYQVIVRKPVPVNLHDRVSAVHAAALLRVIAEAVEQPVITNDEQKMALDHGLSSSETTTIL